MEHSRNTGVIHFKLGAILSSVMNSRAVPLHPTRVGNHPSVQLVRGVQADLGDTARSVPDQHKTAGGPVKAAVILCLVAGLASNM